MEEGAGDETDGDGVDEEEKGGRRSGEEASRGRERRESAVEVFVGEEEREREEGRGCGRGDK